MDLPSLAILVLATCIYTLRNNQLHSRISFFSFMLISLVIFNPKAESNTYFMAICAAAIWAFSSGLGPKTFFLLAFSLLFISVALTDLVPHSFREAVVYPFCFPTIASTCVWVTLSLEIWLGKKLNYPN